MRKLVLALLASALLLPALVVPVAATGPGCSDYGQATVDLAHAGGFGTLVSSVAHGAFAPTFNGVSDLVAWEHAAMCTRP